MSEEAIVSTWKDIVAGTTKWCWLMYDGPSKNKLTCAHKGDSDLGDMVSKVTDDNVYYGAFRFTADDRAKYAFICFVGENTGGMKKGRVSMHRNDVYNFFSGMVGDISATSPEELTVAFIQDKLESMPGVKNVSLV
eukprot:GFYU01010091.1.p1 GENE.GFYU01010091.1~~GFYU01010091.1.p1  ORF type:complete len:149 (+),score=59.48 GFYU01010091.1:40-447(+)